MPVLEDTDRGADDAALSAEKIDAEVLAYGTGAELVDQIDAGNALGQGLLP